MWFPESLSTLKSCDSKGDCVYVGSCPCPSLSPRVCSDSCPLSWWCYLTISSSAAPSPFASILPSIRVFSNELTLCIRWSKYWRFSISPSKEYSGLISFRKDWFDLLAVQGNLKSLLKPPNSKAKEGAQPSLCSNSHIHTWLLEKP